MIYLTVNTTQREKSPTYQNYNNNYYYKHKINFKKIK